METHDLKIQTSEGWTLDSTWSGGPDKATDWQLCLLHRDGVFRVVEIRKNKGELNYEGTNRDAATELFLLYVRRLLMESMGRTYPEGDVTTEA